MSRSEPDATRIVRLWLEEGITALPDRILDDVLVRIPATPQRRSSWLARRTPTMNKFVGFGLAAAAVVILAVFGIQLIGGSNLGGPPQDTSPSPSTPDSPPAPSAVPTLPTGDLEAGTYLMPSSYGGVAFQFGVPAGWRNDSDGLVQKNTNNDSVLETTTGVIFSAWVIDYVFANACTGEGTERPIGFRAEALASALFAQSGGNRRPEPEVAPVAGLAGQVVELATPADLSGCGGRLRLWPGLGGDLDSGWSAGPGQIDRVYIALDGDGDELLVAVATHWPGTSAADRSELEAVVQSIRIP